MPVQKTGRTWVVMADGARARIVAANTAGRWREVTTWESSEAHKPNRDLKSDRMGRAFATAGGGRRHAFSPQNAAKGQAKKTFVGEVVGYIEMARKHRAFDDLVLAAPPAVLGEFRRSLKPPLAKRITREMGKDLTKIPLAKLPQHLPDVLEPIEAARGR